MAFPIVVAALAPQIAAVATAVSNTVLAGVATVTGVTGGVVGGGIIYFKTKNEVEKAVKGKEEAVKKKEEAEKEVKNLNTRVESLEREQKASNQNLANVIQENAVRHEALLQQFSMLSQQITQNAFLQITQQLSSQSSFTHSQNQNNYAVFAEQGISHPLSSDLNNIPMPATLSFNHSNNLQMPSVESLNTSIGELPRPSFAVESTSGHQDVTQEIEEESDEEQGEDTEYNNNVINHEVLVYSSSGSLSSNSSQYSLATLNKSTLA